VRILAAGCGLAAAAARVLAGDVHLDMLKTRTGTFTNVTVVGQSKTDLFIRHARGIANIKISQVDDEAAMRALGLYVEPPPEKQKPAASAPASLTSVLGAVPGASKLNPEVAHGAEERLAPAQAFAATALRQPVQVLAVSGALLLGVYLFFCYCLKLICQKAGHPPGAWIWLPVLQALPLLRAARMSAWWFAGLLVPVANLVVSVIWCFKIAQARGKSALTAIALLLPGLNVLALLYLAFSDGAGAAAEERVVAARESLVFET
jgi:hypothetical protein